MKKIIFAILTLFLVTSFLVVDSHAGYYRYRTAYCAGAAVVVSPRPYRYYYSRPAVYYAPAPVAYYSPAPVVIPQPAPAYYAPAPWWPGISVFFPGVNIHIR